MWFTNGLNTMITSRASELLLEGFGFGEKITGYDAFTSLARAWDIKSRAHG
jgi:hypothetical protein